MNRNWLVALLLCSANAFAQESPLSLSVGLRAWYTDWTTFGYYTNAAGTENLALTQDATDSKLILMPIVSARYADFIASVSGYRSTRFSFPDERTGRREEFDLNVGYFVMESVALTLGYKHVEQSEGNDRYRPAGPVIGVSASAPLGNAWSLYGNMGIGWLKTPGGDAVKFSADYRLTEVGAAYSLSGDRLPRRWTLTAGYRIQVMTSKDAFPTAGGDSLDGRDTTEGFTIGVLATF